MTENTVTEKAFAENTVDESRAVESRAVESRAAEKVVVEKTGAATGRYTEAGIPTGFTSLTPFIAVVGARDAVEFYRNVFGARLVVSTEMGGVLAHAELDFGHGRLQLGEVNPDFHLIASPEGEDDNYSLGLYTSDVDTLVARAEDAGSTIREPITNFVSGDRYASIRDPFGVRWSIMTRVEDLSEEESAARVDEWAAEQG
jgi:PhnB protein